ncbi:MAG: carboxypeptidase regulatory-like domain-containing protein, partial [Planctomycetota bacterium]
IGMSVGPFCLQQTIVADERGRFRVPNVGPGRYGLCSHPRFELPGAGEIDEPLSQGVYFTVGAGETTAADLIRPAGATLRGTTVDAEGRPLPNCLVSWYFPQAAGGSADAVVSDARGRFEFDHVPEGMIVLNARHFAADQSTSYRAGDVDATTGDTSFEFSPAEATETPHVTLSLNPRVVEMQWGSKRSDGSLQMMGGEQDAYTGQLAPNFSGPLLNADEGEAGLEDASQFRLADHAGKVVAIDFWASYCGPCLEALPEINKVAAFAEERDDVTFISVSLDGPDDAEKLAKLMRERGIEFPVIWGTRDVRWEEEFNFFGVPSAFVIGRDGRFAAEKVHGAELLAPVKEAADRPVPEGLGDAPAAVQVALPLDDELDGPGRELSVVVTGPDGAEVYRSDSPVLPTARSVVVPYPEPPAGGAVSIEARVAGVSAARRTLSRPFAAELMLPVKSPRRIRGRVATATGIPAEGVTVEAHGPIARSTVTDAEGRFDLPVIPGNYALATRGTERFAAVGQRLWVIVAKDQDPDDVEIEAVPAVTVRGTIVDESGEPVPNAEAFFFKSNFGVSTREEGVTADAEGRFALPGAPSVGDVAVSVRGSRSFGMTSLRNPTGEENLRIVVGDNLHGELGGRIGTEVDPLPTNGLTDKPLPAREGPTVVILAELSHPLLNWDEIVAAAQKEAESVGAVGPPTIVSVDWGRGAARASAVRLGLDPGAVRWAGPDQYDALSRWGSRLPATIIAVDADGVIRSRW